MKKLLVYLNDYKKESIFGPLFKLLEASFELLVPLVVAAILDIGVATGDVSYIVKMCAVLVLLAVIGLICSITAQYFAARAAVGCATGLRHALFAHIESFSFSELDRVGTATLITRMTSDINQVQNGVNLVLRLFLRSPFIVFGAMIMAFTINAKAAILFVVVIPLLSVVVFGVMFASIPLYKKVQAALDQVLGITRDNLMGSRVIRAFNKQEDEAASFHEKNDALTKIQLYVGRIAAIMNPLTFLIINGTIVALIWTGALQVNSGLITQGEVIALVNYMSQILVELVKLANLIININKSVACANRIQAIFEINPSIKQESLSIVNGDKRAECGKNEMLGKDVEVPAVEFSHAGLVYTDASEEALTNINFAAERGTTVGIIGGTGSGKSSVINLIPRFYEVTSGAVRVDGRDVREYTLEDLRRKIGVVPQKSVLFQGTIRENLRWGNPAATEKELEEALEAAQAKEFVDEKEGRLDYYIEQAGRNLSGGQRQRLAIARALVKKPEILILDDSSSALDFATDAKLRSAIAQMRGQVTVFIVSQRAASIQHADKIVVLDDGQVVGIGTHEQLLKICGVYQEIYDSQFKKMSGGERS